MKKILLILAVVVCVAVAGSALAVAYNDASQVTGTLSADSYLNLSLANSTDTASFTINPGTPQVYTIQCDVTKSTNAPSATLTITLADDDTHSLDLDDVTVALFADAACTSAIAGKTCTGAGTIEVTGLTANTTIYARISVPANLSEANCADVGGTMTISLDQAA